MPDTATDIRQSVFDYASDLVRLQHFLARMRNQVSQATYLQFGDLLWRIHYPSNGFRAATDLPIWEDTDGKILGCGFFLRVDGNPEFVLDPALYDTDLGEAAIAWAVGVARAEGMDSIETSCTATNGGKVAFLERHGFECFGDPYLFQTLRLDEALKPVTVRPQYEITSLRWDTPALSVTGSEPFPRHAYAEMRRAPGYRANLDIKAYVGSTIAAGCICWLDEVDGSGELEPVGTHPGHRRQGLASACITQALNALRAHGARWACVRPAQGNPAAVGLYESLGFRTEEEDLGWRLKW